MVMRHRNEGEVEDSLISALRHGQTTPAAVEKRIADLWVELDDAVYFKQPNQAQLVTEIERLEAALRQAKSVFDAGAKKRLSAYGTEIAVGDVLEDANRVIAERAGRSGGRPVVAPKTEYDRAVADMKVIEREFNDAVRFGDPPDRLDRIRQLIHDAKALVRALGEDMDKPKRSNRGRAKRSFKCQ